MKGYGLPAKYARHGFKKGWKMFKAAKASRGVSGRKRQTSKTKKRVVIVTPISIRGESEMQGRKRKRGRRKVRRILLGKRRGGARKLLNFSTRGIMGGVMDAALAATGVIAGTTAAANIGWVKDQAPWLKALILFAGGIGAAQFLRGPMARKITGGVMASGALALAAPFLVRIEPGEGLAALTSSTAAAGRRFSVRELQALQSMGRPQTPLGRPMSLPLGASAQKSSYRSRISNL